MPFQPVDATAQANIRAEYLGVPMENVLHFFTDESPITSSLLVDLNSNLALAWQTSVMPFLSNQYVMKEIYTVDLSVAAGAVATDTTLAGATGDLSANPLPGNVCFCVSLRTGIRGRSFRGRIYLSGLTEPDVTNNLVDGALVLNYVSGLDDLRTSMLGAGFPWVVVSRISGGVPRVSGVVTTISAVVAVDNRVDTQRRRLS